MAQISYDVGNLTAIDLRKNEGQKTLKEQSRDSVQALIDEIFSCPSTQSQDGPGRIAQLPDCTTPIPREKHVPKAKPLTKWQMFAQKRGIAKVKKDKVSYDEMSGEWRRTYGYKRANDENEQWAIEHKEGTDPDVDPFMKMTADKKLRIKQNRENQVKNLAAARGERVPGTIDLASALSAASAKRNVGRKQQRSMEKRNPAKSKSSHLDETLRVAQHSTASMGKFDKKVSHEPTVAAPAQQKRREVVHDLAKEKGQYLSILKQVVGKAPKEAELFDSQKAVNRLQVASEAAGEPESRFKKSKHESHKKPKRSKEAQKKSNNVKKRRRQ